MKAVIYREYGSPEVLQLAEMPTPVPGDDELLVRVRAVSINGSDREGLIGRPLYARLSGLRRPGSPILGSDIAGVVEAVGKNITDFQPGDEVYGEHPQYHGGFAEYVAIPQRTLARKPAALRFEQAAAIPQGGTIAWIAIREKGRVQPGQQVLINGAGGSAGVFAVQLAKLAGARVTAVDNAAKLDFLRALGADHAVDYRGEDFTRSGAQYDLVLDLIAHRSFFAYQRALKPGGTAFVVGGSSGTLLQMALLGQLVKSRSLRMLIAPQSRKHLTAITELVLSGAVVPVIDKIFPLSETREAMRYVVDGQAKGKVVITVEET